MEAAPDGKSDELTERRKARIAARKNKIKMEEAIEVPDFKSMDRNALVEYANKNPLTKLEGVNGANTDYIREAVKTMDAFEKKKGGNTIEGLSVKFGGTGKAYAKYDDKTHTLLLKKTGSIDAFEKSQKEANLRYRLKWKTDKDYYATETFSGMLWHELGYAVDIDTGQTLSRRLSVNSDLDTMSVQISSYAGSSQNVRVTKRSEAWAENFAAYMEGGKKKRRFLSRYPI